MANFGIHGFPCNDPRPNGKPRQGSIYAAVNALTDADGTALSYLNSGQLVIKRLVAGKNIALADNGQQVSISSTAAAPTMTINGATVTPKSLAFDGATTATDAEGNVLVTIPTPEIPEAGIDVTDGTNSLADAGLLAFGAGFKVTPNADGMAGKAGIQIDTENMPSNLSAFDKNGAVESGINRLTFLGETVSVSRLASGQVAVTVAASTPPDFPVSNTSGVVTPAAKGLKFDGEGVTVTDEAGTPKVTVSGQAKYGVPISSSGTAIAEKPTALNFEGAGVSVATNAEGVTTVTIPGSTGGGGNPVSVLKAGTEIVPAVTGINFVGAGISVTANGGVATVTVKSSKKSFEVWFPDETDPNAALPKEIKNVPEGWTVTIDAVQTSQLHITHNEGAHPTDATYIGRNTVEGLAQIRMTSASTPIYVPVAPDGTLSTTQFFLDISTYNTGANYNDCAIVSIEF